MRTFKLIGGFLLRWLLPAMLLGLAPSAHAACAAGTWSPDGQNNCVAASPGYYVNTPGATSQTLCATGAYCPAGSVSQSPCPAGSFCSTPATLAVCSLGSYCPPASVAQTACSAGTYCATPASQVVCPPGNYCTAGSVAPTQAPAGTYISTTGAAAASAATVCSLGTYCPAGSASQFTCAAGSFCPTPATQVVCSLGSYCPPASLVQGVCPAGAYCATPSSRVACPEGSFCAAGSTAPTNCPAGSFCVAGATAPAPCTPFSTSYGHASACRGLIVGAGVGPQLGVASTLDFGAVELGQTQHLSLLLTNLAQATAVGDHLFDLSILDVDLEGDGAFSLAAPWTPTQLAPGQSLLLDLVYTPSGPGAFAASLSILTDQGAGFGLDGLMFTTSVVGSAAEGQSVPEPGIAPLLLIAAALAWSNRRRRVGDIQRTTGLTRQR